MMQQRFRLRHNDDFARLRREGRAFHQCALLLSFTPNGLTHNRYGFITSKQLGKAVVRNRVRRLLREAVRLLHPRLKVGYDVVLVARVALVAEPFHVVQRILETLCSQAGLIPLEGS